MGKVFVDTSGWVALFVENDENHLKATIIFEKMKHLKMHIYTSDYVIDETITTILSRGNHSMSIFAGEVLFTSSLINRVFVVPHYFQPTWEFYKKCKDKTFNFTDVSCFLIMKELNIQKAFSFDREFTQAGIELIE